MINILAFIITLAQLLIIAAAHYVPWPELFTLFTVQFSPIVIFLHLLSTALEFSGDVSYWLIVGLVYSFIKYFIVSRAISYDGMGFCDVSAIAMEVIYLAFSTYYVVSNSLL